MESLLGVNDIMERYHCCRKTASKIIQSVSHIVYPHLMAYENSIIEWEQRRTVMPARKAQNTMSMDSYRVPKRK